MSVKRTGADEIGQSLSSDRQRAVIHPRRRVPLAGYGAIQAASDSTLVPDVISACHLGQH